MNKTDWKKAFIELVGYIDRYTNNGKNRFRYEDGVWKDIYDSRPRHTNMMPDVMFNELAHGKWERKYDRN